MTRVTSVAMAIVATLLLFAIATPNAVHGWNAMLTREGPAPAVRPQHGASIARVELLKPTADIAVKTMLLQRARVAPASSAEGASAFYNNSRLDELHALCNGSMWVNDPPTRSVGEFLAWLMDAGRETSDIQMRLEACAVDLRKEDLDNLDRRQVAEACFRLFGRHDQVLLAHIGGSARRGTRLFSRMLKSCPEGEPVLQCTPLTLGGRSAWRIKHPNKDLPLLLALDADNPSYDQPTKESLTEHLQTLAWSIAFGDADVMGAFLKGCAEHMASESDQLRRIVPLVEYFERMYSRWRTKCVVSNGGSSALVVFPHGVMTHTSSSGRATDIEVLIEKPMLTGIGDVLGNIDSRVPSGHAPEAGEAEGGKDPAFGLIAQAAVLAVIQDPQHLVGNPVTIGPGESVTITFLLRGVLADHPSGAELIESYKAGNGRIRIKLWACHDGAVGALESNEIPFVSH